MKERSSTDHMVVVHMARDIFQTCATRLPATRVPFFAKHEHKCCCRNRLGWSELETLLRRVRGKKGDLFIRNELERTLDDAAPNEEAVPTTQLTYTPPENHRASLAALALCMLNWWVSVCGFRWVRTAPMPCTLERAAAEVK
jgi:hypothetical protein